MRGKPCFDCRPCEAEYIKLLFGGGFDDLSEIWFSSVSTYETLSNSTENSKKQPSLKCKHYLMGIFIIQSLIFSEQQLSIFIQWVLFTLDIVIVQPVVFPMFLL